MDRTVLIQELQRDEGLKLTVYDDATGKPLTKGSVILGHPSVGIGRALDVNGITTAEAFALCNGDIDKVLNQLEARLPWFSGLDDVRQRALCNMAFNMGVSGLLTFHYTLGYIKAGEYEDAATVMQSSAWYKQVGQRAARIVAMIRTGSA